jgi:hypothetical protein
MSSSDLIDRRFFLASGVLGIGTFVSTSISGRKAFAADAHRFKLAPESVLPADIRKAPEKVREAYRFAIANQEILRYIPCYCGCGSEGHMSNASCYLKEGSKPGNLVFDRMSLN